MSDLEIFSLCGDGFKMITPSGLLTLSRLRNLSELMYATRKALLHLQCIYIYIK